MSPDSVETYENRLAVGYGIPRDPTTTSSPLGTSQGNPTEPKATSRRSCRTELQTPTSVSSPSPLNSTLWLSWNVRESLQTRYGIPQSNPILSIYSESRSRCTPLCVDISPIQSHKILSSNQASPCLRIQQRDCTNHLFSVLFLWSQSN